MAEETKTSFLWNLFNELKYEVLFDVGKNIISNKFGKKWEDIANVFNTDSMREIGSNELEIANLEGDITRRMHQRRAGNWFFGLVRRTTRGRNDLEQEYADEIARARARIQELKSMNDQIKLKNTGTDRIATAERQVTLDKNTLNLRKERDIQRKQEIIDAQEEQIRELEHTHKLNKLRTNHADPDYKSPEELKYETDLIKAKFELKVEQNKLDVIMGVRVDAHAVLKKQSEEAELRAKLAQSEYDQKIAEAKNRNALNPNPNQALLDQITTTELEAKLATAEATKANAALLASQNAIPDLTPAQSSALSRMMVLVENQVNALSQERQTITRRTGFVNDPASVNRITAIDREITALWNEFQNIIDRLRNFNS